MTSQSVEDRTDACSLRCRTVDIEKFTRKHLFSSASPKSNTRSRRDCFPTGSSPADVQQIYSNVRPPLIRYGDGRRKQSENVLTAGSRHLSHATDQLGYGKFNISTTKSRRSKFICRSMITTLKLVALLLFPVSALAAVLPESEDNLVQKTQHSSTVSTSVGRITQLGPCQAIIDDRLVNLQPLQSSGGLPRFFVEMEDQWKLSFNPCISYNFPIDPHSGAGDQCLYVAACKYREINATTGGEFFTVGLQRTAQFQLATSVNGVETSPASQSPAVQNVTDQTGTGNTSSGKLDVATSLSGERHKDKPETPQHIQEDQKLTSSSRQEIRPVLVLRGIRSMKKRKTYIYLICDYSRKDPNDALFTVAVSVPANSSHFYLELRHRCCCPDACPINLVPGAVTGDDEVLLKGLKITPGSLASKDSNSLVGTSGVSVSDDSSNADRSNPPGPRYLWIVLVVNGSIIVSAVLMAALCCRRGGGLMATGPYTYIPALHASRGTVNSVDPRGPMSAMMSGAKSAGGVGISVGLGPGVIGGVSGSGIIAGSSTGNGPSAVDYRDYSTAAVPSSRVPQLDNCVISCHALEIGQRLGGGLYGDTYLCEWKSRIVAAKRITVGIHQSQMGPSDLEWISDCVTVLSKQRHVNLASVIGVCLDLKQPYVISELIEGETLRDLSRRASETSDANYSWPYKIKLCIQIADGMAFLHSAKRPILHRDLRCANILVDRNGKVKIVDFGLMRIVQRLRNECDQGPSCYCQRDFSALPATIRWTAPEVLANPRAFEDNVKSSSASTASLTVLGPAVDVYSFAMVLWEMITCTDPFEDITEEKQVIQLVLDGTRPSLDSLPRGTVPHVKDLIKRCWDQNPDTRPQFKQVALYLKTVLQIVNKMASQPHRDRSDSIRSTTTSIYLRSVFNVAQDT